MTLRTLLVGSALALSACSSAPHRYVATPEHLLPGKAEGLTEEELAIEKGLMEAATNPLLVDYFGRMFKSAVVVVEGFDNLTFTVENDGKKAAVTRGTKPGLRPDYVIPYDKIDAAYLAKIPADGALDDEELYSIHYNTFVPAVRSYFRVPAIYDEAVAKRLALPNFIHMVLKNEKGYTYRGSKREAAATVVNVDGQWLVFGGLIGDPDVRMEVTREKAVEFSKMLYTDAGASQSIGAAMAQLDAIQRFMDSITVYRRPAN